MKNYGFILLLIFQLISCVKNEQKFKSHFRTQKIIPEYASGFLIEKSNGFSVLKILNPQNKTTDTLTYYFIPKVNKVPKSLLAEAEKNTIIRTPIERIIVTSTTDIPLLEALRKENSLIGFPEPKYISSPKTRKIIDSRKVADVGNLLSLNTETILNLNPELIVGFSSGSSSKNFNLFQRSGIPVLMNSSWLEKHPLGRAEWLKVFGLFFQKEKEAEVFFNKIKFNYLEAKKTAKKATNHPTVLSGNMYKDVWYVPGGNSFAAKLIADANANYLWASDENTGSLPLNFEAVFEKAKEANYWIGGGNFKTLKELGNFEEKYKLFDAFTNKNVFTKDLIKGETGGILYYEQGALRADWVLKDLIKIFHPNLAPDYPFHFYQKLN